MKKKCSVLLCAVVFAFAPSAFAVENAGSTLQGLIDSLLALALELVENPENEGQIPGGQDGVEVPSNTSTDTGEQQEMGHQIEPFG